MSNWFLLAIIGHLANAISFIIDKILLGRAFKRSATYAAMIGALSFAALLAVPWVRAWPARELWPAVVAFGGLFVLGLWAFFEALKKHEASRIVPIVGSLVPVFTLFGAVLFFDEHLSSKALSGFFLLLVATALLTSGGKRKRDHLTPVTLFLAIVAGFFFAGATLAGKYVFEHADFIGALVSSRVVAGVVGVLIGLSSKGTRKELRTLFGGKNKRKTSAQTQAWSIFGQICGSVGFVLIHIAIASGSASIINALQAVQYAAIVLVAWFGGTRLARLLKESRTLHVMAMKGTAILLTSVGLWLVSRS